MKFEGLNLLHFADVGWALCGKLVFLLRELVKCGELVVEVQVFSYHVEISEKVLFHDEHHYASGRDDEVVVEVQVFVHQPELILPSKYASPD